MAKVVPLPIHTKLVCSTCGADGEGTCRCGAPYVPAVRRVTAYDKANPGKSTRQAAADLGISQSGVQKARKSGEHQYSGANQFAPDKITGRDGKSYSAKSKPRPEPKEEDIPTQEEVDEEWQQELYDQMTGYVKHMNNETRQKFFAYLKRRYPNEI